MHYPKMVDPTTHFYTDTNILRRIITELKPHLIGEKKCIFLEIPKGGLKQFADFFNQYRQRPNLTDSDRKKNESWSKYYPSIVSAAELNGLQVFEIDHPEHLSGEGKSMDERNEAMAQNASQLLSNATCESAILFVGKAHISPLEFHLSVVDLIRKKGIKPITYNLVDFSERSHALMSSWSGLECNVRDILPSAFSNFVLSKETALYPFLPSQRKPLWNDFNYSIAR